MKRFLYLLVIALLFLGVASSSVVGEMGAESNEGILLAGWYYGTPAEEPSGGPDSWYWAYGLGDSDFTSSLYVANTYHVGSPITVGTGGTLTYASVKVHNQTGDSVSVRICVYDTAAGDSPIATDVVSVPDATNGWIQNDDAFSVSISSGTYYVLFSSDVGIDYYYEDGEDGRYTEDAYSSGCPTGALSEDTGYGDSAKLYVD